MDIKLPHCLTAAKVKRDVTHVSWFALLEHIRTRVAQDDRASQVTE
jgi:hypothetical protein